MFVTDRPLTSDEAARAIDGFLAIRDGTNVPALEAIHYYDTHELYREDGARTMADWISFRRGCAPRTARELVDIARAIADLPALKQALVDGRICWDKAVLVAKIATPEDEALWLRDAEDNGYPRLEFLVRSAMRFKREEIAAKHWERSVVMWRDPRGFFRLRARLPGAEGAVVEKAIERIQHEMGPDNPDGTYNNEEWRNADALVELASTRLGADDEPDRATVVLHVEISELNKIRGTAVLEEGGLLGAEVARRLACDSRLQTVIDTPTGETVAVGTTMRTVPRWLRRLLMKRDKGCRFADCGRTRGLHAHHIIHFAHGGPTVLENLVMLCPYHHRLVHDGGWRILIDGMSRMRFIRPDGRPLNYRPIPLQESVRKRIFGPVFASERPPNRRERELTAPRKRSSPSK